MKTNKYIVLYYLSFVITMAFVIFSSYKYLEILSLNGNTLLSEMSNNILGIINLILVIVFTILLIKKKKIQVESMLFPYVYLAFFVIVLSLCFLFNSKVMISYMHFEYYTFFIGIGYLLFNIYSLLLIKIK